MEKQLMTVVQVSRQYDVSARMLRYYEKVGLIRSVRAGEYAYRMYDAENVERVRAILLLRKLRISLRDIGVLLKDGDRLRMISTLERCAREMDDEIASLTLIRNVVDRIIDRCRAQQQPYRLTEDSEVLRYISTLPAPAKKHLQEVITMSEVNQANEILARNSDVRIIHLPAMPVAACRAVGENPEEAVGNQMSLFIQESHLYESKPDARMFGFNAPNPGVLADGMHGYEVWVTIPENLPLKEGVERKRMAGGLYAVLNIRFPEFQRWQELVSWAENSPDYAPNWQSGPENMHGMLEEHINWVYSAHLGWPEDGEEGRIDLYLPIKKK